METSNILIELRENNQWRIQDLPEEGRYRLRCGCQPIILPNSPQKLYENKSNKGSRGRDASLVPPWTAPTPMLYFTWSLIKHVEMIFFLFFSVSSGDTMNSVKYNCLFRMLNLTGTAMTYVSHQLYYSGYQYINSWCMRNKTSCWNHGTLTKLTKGDYTRFTDLWTETSQIFHVINLIYLLPI